MFQRFMWPADFLNGPFQSSCHEALAAQARLRDYYGPAHEVESMQQEVMPGHHQLQARSHLPSCVFQSVLALPEGVAAVNPSVIGCSDIYN